MALDLLVAYGYLTAHTLVLFYQAVALSVAINSNSNVLLTLLISNNFTELKTNVFKRCEAENLFQASRASPAPPCLVPLRLRAALLPLLLARSPARTRSSASTCPCACSPSPPRREETRGANTPHPLARYLLIVLVQFVFVQKEELTAARLHEVTPRASLPTRVSADLGSSPLISPQSRPTSPRPGLARLFDDLRLRDHGETGSQARPASEPVL